MSGVVRGLRLLAVTATAVAGLGAATLPTAVSAASPAVPIGITVTPSGNAQVLTPLQSVCRQYKIVVAGMTATVKGQGFNANDTVTLKFDAITVGTTTASSTGAFTKKFNVPAAVAGQHAVTATGAHAEHATQLVQVGGSTCFHLAATGTNHTMSVHWTVGGVDAHTATSFVLNNHTIKQTTTNATGGVDTTFTTSCPPAGSTATWVVNVIVLGGSQQASGFVTIPSPC